MSMGGWMNKLWYRYKMVNYVFLVLYEKMEIISILMMESSAGYIVKWKKSKGRNSVYSMLSFV